MSGETSQFQVIPKKETQKLMLKKVNKSSQPTSG